MGLIHTDTFVCVDLETTGLDTKKDKIIEIAATLFTFDKKIATFETLVDPNCIIPAASIEIHNITQDMVAGKPKIKEVLPTLLEFIGNNIIVGHGILFDIEVIQSTANELGIPIPRKYPFIDTLRMARIYGQSPINSLEKLREHFNIQPEGAHRAMNDVIVNIEVFKYLSKPYKTTEDLVKKLERPIRLKTMPLGKHKGRKFDEVPIEYLEWAVRKDFDDDLLFSLRSEIKNRKRGNSFEQAANPFTTL